MILDQTLNFKFIKQIPNTSKAFQIVEERSPPIWVINFTPITSYM